MEQENGGKLSDQDIMDIKREDMDACQEPFALASG
jgi:hypothetical protein